MKRFRLAGLLLALTVILAGCLPGLGTMEPLAVVVETPHIATVTFTPAVDVQEAIVNIGGATVDTVRAEDGLFTCQPFRSGWDCYVHGQEDPTKPRVIHRKGEPLKFIVYATDANEITASVSWQPADQR